MQSRGEGNAGSININVNSLSITNAGQINARIFGTGNVGDVRIEARDISLEGVARRSGTSGTE